MATVFYRGFYRKIENLRLQCAWSGEVTGKNSKIYSNTNALWGSHNRRAVSSAVFLHVFKPEQKVIRSAQLDLKTWQQRLASRRGYYLTSVSVHSGSEPSFSVKRYWTAWMSKTQLSFLRCPETLFISHENANFLFSVFRVVQGEAKTPKIMGCCRANFAFLHALKIGTFRGKWTPEWVFKTSHFVCLALYFSNQQ